MKSESRLPILTFALGWAGAQAIEVFRDRRASKEEREARQAELQRSTLLALQEALLEISNLAEEAAATSFVAAQDHPDQSSELSAYERVRETEDQLSRAQDKARLLTSRVRDDQARKAATTFLTAASMVSRFNPETDRADRERLQESYGEAIELLGKQIRERY
jgi:hypothetical protein